MLDEVTVHLEDAGAVGRSVRDVVGWDVRALAVAGRGMLLVCRSVGAAASVYLEEAAGWDVRAFVAARARARSPFPRRVLRAASIGCFAVGAVLSVICVLWWTAQWGVTAAGLA
ncbi:hypothetical protein [Streptomyces sp. NPDC047014]|uniref:hypothetical protein n=1 Tax=Streptomyces sp. NPDC047014 TaxID=3155736 RepID=UPI0033D5005A